MPEPVSMAVVPMLERELTRAPARMALEPVPTRGLAAMPEPVRRPILPHRLPLPRNLPMTNICWIVFIAI